MLKLSRKTEFALLGLRYMHEAAAGAVVSVKEIATHYDLSEALLAKAVQRLKTGRVVTSVKGSAGGYSLARPLTEVGLLEVLELLDEQTLLVECVAPVHRSCHQLEGCDIREPLRVLGEAIARRLQGVTLAEFYAAHATIPGPGT